jgi:hypothetical protein
VIGINAVKTVVVTVRTEYVDDRQIRLKQFFGEFIRDYTGDHALAVSDDPLEGLSARIAPHEAPVLYVFGIRGDAVDYPPAIPA